MKDLLPTETSPIMSDDGVNTKRNISNHFLIPWDNIDQKTMHKKVSDSFLIGRRPNFYHIHSGIREFDKTSRVMTMKAIFNQDKIEICISVFNEGLNVGCSCGGCIGGLCSHAYYLIKKLLEDTFPFHKLSHDFLSRIPQIEQVKVSVSHHDVLFIYSKDKSPLLPHSTIFGKKLSKLKSIHSGGRFFDRNRTLMYGLQYFVNAVCMPILLPYSVIKSKKADESRPYAEIQKSYLITLSLTPFGLSQRDLVLHSISKEMLALVQSYGCEEVGRRKVDFRKNIAFYLDAIDHNSVIDAILLNLWKKAICELDGQEIISFKQDFGSWSRHRIGGYAGRKASLSTMPLDIRFELSFNGTVFKLEILLYKGDEQIKDFEFLGSWDSYFLAALPLREIFVVSSVRDEKVIKYFRYADFNVSVFPEDFESFKHKYLIPLADLYNIKISLNADSPVQFTSEVPVQVRKRKVDLALEGDYVTINATVCYEYGLEANPLTKGNLLFAKEMNEKMVYLRDKLSESQLSEQLIALHPDFLWQVEEGFFYLPFAHIKKNNLLSQMIARLEDNQIDVNLTDSLAGVNLT